MLSKISIRQWVLFLCVLLVSLVIFISIILFSRIGKVEVTVETVPFDTKLFVNNKPADKNSLFLKPGKYIFTAKRDGFSDDTFNAQIKEGGENWIGLTPNPTSLKAEEILNNEKDSQLQREYIGGRMASISGDYIEQETPILESLPYTDVSGPFTINYGGSKNREYGSFIEISTSTPVGRERAIHWIREQGYSPTDLEIRYLDFSTPITIKGTD